MKKIVCLAVCFTILSVSAWAQNWNIEENQTAGVSFLHEELRKSGLNQLGALLRFGSAELRNRLANAERAHQEADPFDKADALAKVKAVEREIEVAKEEIAKKTFFGDFSYSAPLDRVQVDGDKSSFAMVFQTGFAATKVAKVSFPLPNVTGIKGEDRQGQIVISGATDNIRELVRNSAGYRANIWFTNLRLNNSNAISADVANIEVVVKTQPGEGDGQRNVLKIKDVEYAFRWCPAGTFMMGSPENEANRNNDEGQHRVSLSRGFWMLETEVTQAMWASVMGNNPSVFKGEKLPVERVSWNDCQEFIKQLNELKAAPAGFKFSLPTEAQWEYACRAGTTTAYHFGNSLRAGQANFYDSRINQTTEVGSYPANAWGLKDMHGNVWEWCLDCYGNYSSGAVTDPTGADRGVLRGGSCDCLARNCRSALRSTGIRLDRSYYCYVGVRISLVRAE